MRALPVYHLCVYAWAMDYSQDKLGTMDAIRAIFHARPVVELSEAQRVLDKHDLGRATRVTPLGPYVTNFIHRIDRDGSAPLVLKGQYLPTATWDVAVEAVAIRLLREGTDLPVPPGVVYDGARDVLDHAFCLIEWLEGRPTLEVVEEAPESERLGLARQIGAIHRAIHDCPVPPDAGLPKADLRRWTQLVQRMLLADDELHRNLGQLCPAFEETLLHKLEGAETPALRPPVLAWRDGSPGNTVCQVDEDGARISGVFDFQSAIIMQPHWDLVKAFNHYVPGSGSDRRPTPEWRAFCEGYGTENPMDSAEREPGSIVFAAMHTRHWYEAVGFFHPQTPLWLDGLLRALGRLRQDS